MRQRRSRFLMIHPTTSCNHQHLEAASTVTCSTCQPCAWDGHQTVNLVPCEARLPLLSGKETTGEVAADGRHVGLCPRSVWERWSLCGKRIEPDPLRDPLHLTFCRLRLQTLQIAEKNVSAGLFTSSLFFTLNSFRSRLKPCLQNCFWATINETLTSISEV